MEKSNSPWTFGKPDAKIEKLRKGVKIVGGNSFPYLDLNMNFNENDGLNFSVYSKPDYKTKYVNSGSKHTESCLKAIPTGLAIRLAGLTTRSKANENRSLSELYPVYHKALREAGLIKVKQKTSQIR